MSPAKTAKAPVYLLWGEDAFLLREAAFELLGDLRPTEVDAAEWQGGETADLATPLWSTLGRPARCTRTTSRWCWSVASSSPT